MLLSLEHIQAFYGPSQALFDIGFEVADGEVVALMGRNGVGKSTTVKVICRLLPEAGGKIHFAGKDMAKLKPFEAGQLGIGLVPEGRRCFASLSVWENLMVAARPARAGAATFWDLPKIYDLFPRLGERKNQLATSLSGGEQQMLAIGRALMTNPRLLILDEATEGLAPLVRAEIWQAIRRLKQDQTMAILIIDKTLKELSPLADKMVILDKGVSVWQGSEDYKAAVHRYTLL